MVGGENPRWCIWKDTWKSLHANYYYSDISRGFTWWDCYLGWCLETENLRMVAISLSWLVTRTWFTFACMHCWSGLLIVLWGTSLHLSWRFFLLRGTHAKPCLLSALRAEPGVCSGTSVQSDCLFLCGGNSDGGRGWDGKMLEFLRIMAKKYLSRCLSCSGVTESSHHKH